MEETHDIYPIVKPTAMEVMFDDEAVFVLSERVIEDLTWIAIRNQIGYAEAVAQAVADENFLDRLHHSGARFMIEQPGGTIRYLDRADRV